MHSNREDAPGRMVRPACERAYKSRRERLPSTYISSVIFNGSSLTDFSFSAKLAVQQVTSAEDNGRSLFRRERTYHIVCRFKRLSLCKVFERKRRHPFPRPFPSGVFVIFHFRLRQPSAIDIRTECGLIAQRSQADHTAMFDSLLPIAVDGGLPFSTNALPCKFVCEPPLLRFGVLFGNCGLPAVRLVGGASRPDEG